MEGAAVSLALARGALRPCLLLVVGLVALPALAEVRGPGAGPAREDLLALHAPESPAVPGQVVVRLAPWLAPSVTAALAALPAWVDAGRVRPGFARPARAGDWRRGVFVVEVASARPLEDVLDAFRALPGVVAAQPNFVYAPDRAPSDPDYPLQYAHALAGAESAWGLETGDPASVIAVLGGGIEADHPDLAANLWENADEIPGNGLDDDANGFVDDRHGWDFRDGDADPAPQGSAHETAVAGVAAAVGNSGQGIAGVSWRSRLMPVRVAYTSLDVAAGIDYATDNGAWVINMSFGNYAPEKYGPDGIVAAAVAESAAAGVVLVATAGNDGVSTPRYPAALDEVLAVAATDARDARAAFSNHGAWVDVAAPGSDIHTTTLGGGYAAVSGTSFAAPYVAGLAALLLSKDPGLDPDSVRRRILFSVDRLATDLPVGTGRVHAGRALALESDPELFSLVRSPRPDASFPAWLAVEGLALGDSFRLAHRREGSTGWTEFASGAAPAAGELGVLDTTALAPGRYEIRLRAERGGALEDHVVAGTVVASQTVMPGWPQANGASSLTSATFADLDADGDLEVLAHSASGVRAWHHDGADVAGWPVPAGAAALRGALSVDDVDGDGDPEVLKLDYAGELMAWHHDGTPVAGLARRLGPQSRSAPVLGDLDGDGAAEVIATSYGGPTELHVLRGDGTPLAGFPVALEANQQSAPTLADLDGDGVPEIVLHGWTLLYAFRANGAPVAGWPVALQGSHTSPLALDVDGDGDDEIVAFTRDAVRLFDGDGAVRLAAFLGGALLSYENPALGDVDGDGGFEVCLADEAGAVHLISLVTGAERPGWPRAVGDEASCSIADVDADPAQELLVTTRSGELHAFDADGSALDTGSWPLALGSAIYSSATLGDLDADGAVEAAALTLEGDLWVLRFADSVGAAPAHWPTYQGGPAHTGALALPEPGGVGALLAGLALLRVLARRRAGR